MAFLASSSESQNTLASTLNSARKTSSGVAIHGPLYTDLPGGEESNIKRHEKSSETQISRKEIRHNGERNNKESEESTECGFDRWSSADERETAIIN